MSLLKQGVATWLFCLIGICGLFLNEVHAAHIVDKGSTNYIKEKITNKADSAGTLTKVNVSATVDAGWVTLTQPTDSDVDILPGNNKVFTIVFKVSANAPAGGEATIKVKVTTTTQNITPHPQEQILPVTIKVNDKPDERYDVCEAHYPLYEVSGTPTIAILENGFFAGADSLINRFKEPTIPQEIDFLPGIVNDYPTLIIPSGGLYGLENSVMFKARLEEYVKNGGTLICFTQQRGYEFNALPGGKVSGYGWTEDQSCHYRAVSIATSSVIFAGQDDTNLDASADGYFTNWPDNATILLRRTKNDMPAMLMYPYGKGWVVACTLYSDWGYGNSQATSDEIRLTGDLISWAKNPTKPIPEYKPGNPINLPVTIINNTNTNADKVILKILNPDRQPIGTRTIINTVPAYGSATITFDNYTAPSGLGIYWLNYLLDATGNSIIQPETQGERFAVSKHLSGPLPQGLSFSVQSEAENYMIGNYAEFTILIWNHTSTPRTVTCKHFFPHHYWETRDPQYGGDWGHPQLNLTNTLTIPANDVGTFSSPIVVKSDADRLWAYFYENGTQIGEATRGFYGVQPSVNIDVQTAKKLYGKGDNVQITLNFKNKGNINYESTINLIVNHPIDGKIFEHTSTVNLSPYESERGTVSFTLPNSLSGGIYLVQVEAYSNQLKIGAGSNAFELPKAILGLTPILPDTFTTTSNVSFKIENIGFIEVESSRLNVSLMNPDNNIIWQGTSTSGTISVNGSMTMNFNISIPELKFGVYVLTYTLTYENKVIKGEIKIPLTNIIKVDLDKSSYRVRDNLNGTITLTNTGRFKEDLEVITHILDCNFMGTTNISLSPNQTKTVTFSTIIPETANAGLHNGTVTKRLGTSSIHKNFKFTIPESQLVLSLDKINYSSGETGEVIIKNTGGVDTTYNYNLSLIGPQGITIYQNSNNINIQAGGQNSINFNIDSQAVNGSYYLFVVGTDSKTGKIINLSGRIEISGLKANLTVSTDKKAYFTNETITTTVEINNLDGAITNGTLSIKVFRTAKGIIPGGRADIVWVVDATGSMSDDHENLAANATTFANALANQGADYQLGVVSFESTSSGYYFNQFGSRTNSAPVKIISCPAGMEEYKSNLPPQPVPMNQEEEELYSKTIIAVQNGPYGTATAGVGDWTTDSDVFSDMVRRVGSFGGTEKGCSALQETLLHYTFRPSSDKHFILLTDENGNDNSLEAATIQKMLDNGVTVWLVTGILPGNPTFDTYKKIGSQTGGQYFDLTTVDWEVVLEAIGAAIPQEGLIWEKDIFVPNITNRATITTNIKLDPALNGKFYLVANLNSKTQQTIAKDDTSFYITNSQLSLDMEADKKVYKPGATVTITSIVHNGADITADNLILTLQIGSETIFNSGTFSLTPQQTINFITEIKATTSFKLHATVGTVTVSDEIMVEIPQVEMTITAPEIVGREEFGISVLLRNIGMIDALVNLNLGGKRFNNVNLPMQGREIFHATFTITQDTTIDIILSGDVEQTVQKNIKFGEKSRINITPQNIYPEGNIVVPFTLANIGSLSTQFELTFNLETTNLLPLKAHRALSLTTLPDWCLNTPQIVITANNKNRGAQTLKSPARIRTTAKGIEVKSTFSIPVGQSISGDLVFNLLENPYLLSHSSIFGTGAVSFKVAKDNRVNVEMTINSEELNPDGSISVKVDVENTGANRFIGALRLNTGFYQNEVDLDLNVAGTQTITFNIPILGTPTMASGTYTANISVLFNGNPILTKQKEFILAPKFTFIQIPQALEFNIDERGTITVSIKNIGTAEGEAKVHLAIMDIFDDTKSIWLGLNEVGTVTFNFTLSDDLEDRDYLTSCRVGNEERLIKFHVKGIKINVEASLDKIFYVEGSTATLTIDVLNLNPQISASMFTKVLFNDYEEKATFTLGVATSTLTFEVPVKLTSSKLFYGVYMATGRAIHLNAKYIHPVGIVYTDKQVYNAGSTVTVTIFPPEDGTFTMVAPGHTGTYTIVGTTTIQFKLPDEMVSGTYYINYTFGNNAYEYKFDVIGYSGKIFECKLDKSRYNSKDTIKLKFKVATNQTIPCILRIWIYNPIGEYKQLIETGEIVIDLESLIDLTGTFSTSCSGLHSLIYGLYKGNLLLAAGEDIFDVGGIVLTDFRGTKKADKFELTINTFGVGATATLQILVDYAVENQEEIFLNGFQEFKRDVVIQGQGEHIVSCNLQDPDGATSTKELRIIVAEDTTPPSTPEAIWEGSITTDLDVTTGTYTVYWNPATDTSGIAYYELQERMSDEVWTTIGTTTATNATLFISGKQKVVKYSYRVRARDNVGVWGTYSISSDGIRIVDKFVIFQPGMGTITIYPGVEIEVPVNAFGTVSFSITELAIPVSNLENAIPEVEAILQGTVLEILSVDINNNESQPSTKLKLTLTYNDPDPVNEIEDLGYRIYKFNQALNRWEIVPGEQKVDAGANTVSVEISTLSMYAVFSPYKAAGNLNNLRVYPNPCKPHLPGHNKIIFDNLTSQCKIQIYNVAGELVDEKEFTDTQGKVEWNLRNEFGKEAATGVYFYVITNPAGEKVVDKLAIIR